MRIKLKDRHINKGENLLSVVGDSATMAVLIALTISVFVFFVLGIAALIGLAVVGIHGAIEHRGAIVAFAISFAVIWMSAFTVYVSNSLEITRRKPKDRLNVER